MENLITLKKDKYDSKYFGVKVGNLSYPGNRKISSARFAAMLDDMLAKAKKQGFDYLVFSVGDKQGFLKEVLEKMSFEQAASYVDFKLNCSHIKDAGYKGIYDLSLACKDDLSGIGDIAEVAFRKSRLYRIKFAPLKKVDNYHVLWVNNLFRSKRSKVFAAKSKGKVRAFLASTVNSEESSVRINLVAVSSRMRGKGVGSELMKYFFEWAGKEKLKTIYVKTQEENSQARAFYTARGFSLYSSDRKYHKYL